MLWISTKRIIKSGFVNFWRNGVVSLAGMLVMTITLFVIGSIIFLGAILNTSLEQIKNKVDISVYFTTAAPEEEILSLKKSIEALTEVSFVAYTTRDEALANFRERHKNDYLTLQALDELGENPLGASLSIKAKETSQYESITKFLESKEDVSSGGKKIIDKINYYQNKIAIDKLTKIIDGANKIGLAVTIVLIAISIIITFNTIRLAIYTAREEIAVMRLVGGNNAYIRGPFLIEGLMYGAISSIITMAIFYPVTLWLGGATENFFGGINLFDYYLSNFWQLFAVILLSGILLGVVSSFLAVRKYLDI